MIIDLDRTGKMLIADFVWNKKTNELVTKETLWVDGHIPAIIFIHGKTRDVKYVYTQTLHGSQLAEFTAAQSEFDHDLLPKAYVEF